MYSIDKNTVGIGATRLQKDKIREETNGNPSVAEIFAQHRQ